MREFFVPFWETQELLAAFLRRQTGSRVRPVFWGITAQGWPYCPGAGRLTEFFRVPGGLVWWKEVGGEVRWMWQPLTPGE